MPTDKVKVVRLSTLAAIGRHIDCEPEDILAYEASNNAELLGVRAIERAGLRIAEPDPVSHRAARR